MVTSEKKGTLKSFNLFLYEFGSYLVFFNFLLHKIFTVILYYVRREKFFILSKSIIYWENFHLNNCLHVI